MPWARAVVCCKCAGPLDPNRPLRHGRRCYTCQAEHRRMYDRKRHKQRSADPQFRAAAVARTKAWCEANPERRRTQALTGIRRRMATGKLTAAQVAIWNRRSRLRSFGLTEESYAALLEQQQQRCAICQQVVSKPYIDHDHSTGKVRGLLCSNCNFGLGQFKDNPSYLDAAISYLVKQDPSFAYTGRTHAWPDVPASPLSPTA